MKLGFSADLQVPTDFSSKYINETSILVSIIQDADVPDTLIVQSWNIITFTNNELSIQIDFGEDYILVSNQGFKDQL